MGSQDATVAIVGCGAAGVTAAIGLARKGIPVVVIEGAPHPGAENWSGAVYFCENLARPEILGEDLLRQTALERRVVKRGILATDGRAAPGMAVRDEDTFAHCYTALRPVFDHDLAHKARLHGARILNGTTATALLRDGDRVRGVLTDRGPLHADVVFLAEGDASNLVSREGLERIPAEGGLARPAFLQGIKEVLALPAHEIERRFDVGPSEGAAFEILLRNGAAQGRPVPLNAGAFLYTNRESLSLGIVAPLENLTAWKGEHNRLMEWLKGLPALEPLLEGARPVSFGAKVIRGGGHREIPRMVLDGLAVGGAASGIGVDFPYPNYTGPATFMGWAFSEAVARILEGGGSFDSDTLQREYVARVEASPYMRDVRHLRDWPRFVAGAREFFGRQVDLVAGTAHVLAGPPGPARHALAARLLFETLPPKRLLPFGMEMLRATRALGLGRGFLADLPVLVFWWIVNVLLGFFPRRTRVNARLDWLMWTAGDAGTAPPLVRWMLWRLRPGLAEALHHLYRNDGTPLEQKLGPMRRAVLSRLALFDFVLWPLLGTISWVWGALQAGWFRASVVVRRTPIKEILETPFFRLRETARSLTDLGRVRDRVDHDRKLATINYWSDERPHIHFHAGYDEQGLPDESSPVFSVCPARVYQKEVDQSLSTSVAVLHENCVRCETCWRADDRHVDWGRIRGQKLVFQAYSSAESWLSESLEAACLADLQRRPEDTPGDPDAAPEHVGAIDVPAAARTHFRRLLSRGRAFRDLNERSPAVLSGADQALLADLGEAVLGAGRDLGRVLQHIVEEHLQDRLDALASWVRLSSGHLEARRFFHFEGDVRLLLEHHLVRLGELLALDADAPEGPPPAPAADPGLGGRLDELLDRERLGHLEQALQPDGETCATLLDLAREIGDDPEQREAVLEELGRRSPALGVLLSRHLLASEVARAAGILDALDGRLAGLVDDGFSLDAEGVLSGGAAGVLLGGVELFVFRFADGRVAAAGAAAAGMSREIVGGIGLRGAGPGRLLARDVRPLATGSLSRSDLRPATRDLVVIACSMGTWLQQRALDHAESRVQFPGLFRDVRGRDGIAKFGAVQAMLAGIAAGVEVLRALREGGHGQAAAWALSSDILGCSPRSIAYLAGQVLGGTAYSEEDEVCRFYRDASALSRMPGHVGRMLAEQGAAWVEALRSGEEEVPGLDGHPLRPLEDLESAPLVERRVAPLRDALAALQAALRERDASCLESLQLDLGRLAVQVAAVDLVARRVEERLDRGRLEVVTLPCIDALAHRAAVRARGLAARHTDGEELASLGRRILREAPDDGSVAAAGVAYDEWLGAQDEFRSGDLLLRTGGSDRLCLTPELLDSDAGLRARDREVADLFRERFEAGDHGGRPYTRVVEEAHHIPLEDVRFLLDRGAFRMVIPVKHGGLGLKKAAYYLDCTRMMRHGDPAQAIIVMGSTSIGTTPVLIGLEQDLPGARQALEKLLADPEAVTGVRREIEDILRISGTPQVLTVGGRMKALAGRIKKVLQKEKASRLVFQEFLACFQKAGLAGMRRDLDAFVAGLRKGLTALDGWQDRVRQELEALPHREAAHAFYLQLISSGRISAFALTEPSAGSDTARIRTRARRVSVPVERDDRGFWTFVPEGGAERRNLFTYDRLEFVDGALHFRDARDHLHAVVLRDFAYAEDEGEEQFRYVELDGGRVDIHDLGRVDESGAVPAYHHFVTNGAKMWITNGSVAGVMILYALTERGPTALMLDAHAEGLVVGSDESKMGQRGSATNELTLQDVRIPVDQVIGIEGRGQENALETLNVGRAGLAVTSVGLMHEVLADVREGLGEEEPPAWALREIGRMALDLVACESLAWQVVGRFDHPGTQGIRMESAIAKATVSEALHRLLTRAERILPAEWALDAHEFEKRRRDARVLTIYEGTNEIQRFLLLKDLMDTLDLDRLAGGPCDTDGERLAPVRAVLDRARERVLAAVTDLRRELGPRAWQVANLQPRAFPLVEACMRVAATSAAIHRAALARRLLPAEQGESRVAYLLDCVELLARDLERWQTSFLARADLEGERVRAGRDPLTQEIADRSLLARESEGEERPEIPRSEGVPDLQVAVLVDVEPVLAPQPRVRDGLLREPLALLGDPDRAVIAHALELARDCSGDVTVVGIGSVRGVDVLEECLALGASRAFLLDTAGRNVPAPLAAEAVCDLLRTREQFQERPFDVVLGHVRSNGLLLPVARRLELEPLIGVHWLSVQAPGEGRPRARVRYESPEVEVAHDLPLLALLTAELSEPHLRFDMAGWRRARAHSVSVIDFRPESAGEARILAPESAGEEAPASAGDGPLGTRELADLFLAETGLVGGAEARTGHAGPLARGARADLLSGLDCLAVVESDAEGDCAVGTAAALRAAVGLARGGDAGALVLVPVDAEPALRAALGEVLATPGLARAAVLARADLAALGAARRAQLVEHLLHDFRGSVVFAWSLRNAGLLAAEGRLLSGLDGELVRGVDHVGASNGELILSGATHEGRLRFELRRPVGAGPVQLVTGPEVTTEASSATAGAAARVMLLEDDGLSLAEDALARAIREAGGQLGVASLADAEFIIDVGYGVGSRDGIEEVIDPLREGLEALGVKNVQVGATRKVTMDLGLLPESCQIGQTGVRVDPRVVLAIGVSGAPQHMEYIGERAVIFAFNRDAEAPLMIWNRSRKRPVVHPVPGDLFVEVPRFLATLRETLAG